MSTTIQIKRSSTASGVPLATDLAVGELAVNLADKRLFTKQSDGTVIELSTNPTDLDAATLRIDGVEITASAAELNKLDGFTGSTAELNLLDGLTATTIELNTLDGITASTAELNKLDGYTGSTAELNILDGITATTTEINKLDGFTGTVADLNYAKDLRATGVTTAELDVLDGITATTTELNYTDGVTSNIQTQLDAMVEKAGDTMTGDLSLGDNVKAKFGAGDDLQIYHTGTQNYIEDAGTGNLNFKSNGNFYNFLDGSNATVFQIDLDDATRLYHNTTQKLATTSTGVDVTGTVTADGLTVDGNGTAITLQGNNGAGTLNTLQFRDTDTATATGQDIGRLEFYSDDVSSAGVQAYIAGQAAGGSGIGRLIFGTGFGGSAVDRMLINSNGNVEFYEDTGTTAKMVWSSSAESLGIGTANPSYQLTIEDSTDAIMQLKGSSLGRVYFGDSASDNVGRIQYYHIDNSMQFYTNGTKQATIDSSGNVGIGTASPSAPLTINGGDGLEPVIKASDGGANGYTLLADAYTSTDSQVNLGIKHASAAAAFSWGVKPSNTTDTYVSSTGLYSKAPQAIEMSTDGIKFLQGASATVATNSAVAMSERARLDSSGNLLVGRTTGWDLSTAENAGAGMSGDGAIFSSRLEGASLYAQRSGTDGDMAEFWRGTSKVGSIGKANGAASQGLYISGDDVGFSFEGNTNNAITPYSTDTGDRDAAVDLGSPTARFKDLYLSGGVLGDTLTFKNNNGTEKARLDSIGNFLVGATSSSIAVEGFKALSNGVFYSVVDNSQTNSILNKESYSSGTTYFMDFRLDTVSKGSISSNGTSVSYNTSSDERLKENIQDTTHTVNINDIRVREFDWKADGEHQRFGFIAQELETVYPEAVSTDDSEEQMKSVDYSKLVPLLVKEIQTLKARIETLENN